MMKNGIIHKLLNDRNFTFSAIALCAFMLLFLPTTLHAQSTLMEKGDSCRLQWKYNKALGYYQQAYSDPAIAKDTETKFQLLERIMRCHDVLRHWREMPESSYRLYTLAKEKGDSARVAMALFMRGKRLHLLGQQEDGILICLNAVEQLKRTDYSHKDHELAHLYAILTRLYTQNGQYDEALRMSQLQEHYVELSRKCHTDEWYQRNWLRVIILRLTLLNEMGRTAEADSLYRQYRPTKVTDPLCGEALHCYFKQRHMNNELMQFFEAAIQNIREDGDTIGRNMQRLMDDLGDTYYLMGQYEHAAECYKNVTMIADTLAVRSLDDLNTEVHKVIDSERDIAKHRQILTIVIAAIVFLLVIFLLLLYMSLVVRRKNRKMTNLIQQLMRYRDIVIQNGDSDEMADGVIPDVSQEELQRFKEVDKRIMKEQLFANSDFGRDDLMRLLGVDKNALPGLISSITGTNVPGYINNKRMEYAVKLIKMHPEYTLGAIAEACGIKSPTTFIRNFKSVYDMTPSEYRKQLEEGITPPRPSENRTDFAL